MQDLFSQIHDLGRQLRKQKDELNDQTRVIDSFRRDNKNYETNLAAISRDKVYPSSGKTTPRA
jgi:uncharacterized protein YaaN involved in tellurite resistance